MNLKHKRPLTNMSIKEKIDQILELCEEVRKDTGQSPLYNYGYREIMHREVLRKLFPTLERSVGSHGSDAKTDELNFIEFKSGFWIKQSDPTIEDWKPIMFDMSKKKDQKKIYEYQALGCGLWRRTGAIPVANFYIGPEHIKKLHPLFDKVIQEYDQRESGRQENTFTLTQILEYVDQKDIIWFKNGEQVENV